MIMNYRMTMELDTETNKVVIHTDDDRRFVLMPVSKRAKSIYALNDDKPCGVLNDAAQVCRFLVQNILRKGDLAARLAQRSIKAATMNEVLYDEDPEDR